MSRTRASRSTDNELVTGLTRMRSDVDGIKAAQRVGGANVLGYFAKSTNDSDYTVSIPASSQKTFVFQFNAANAIFAPFAQLFVYYSYSTPVLSNPVPPYANGSAVLMNMQNYPLYNQTSQWYATFTNTATTAQTVYIKLVINSSATGVLTIFPQ